MDEREDVREQIYKKICEETILQYKSDTLDIDAMEVDIEGTQKMIYIMDRTLYEMLYKNRSQINQSSISFIRTFGNKATVLVLRPLY